MTASCRHLLLVLGDQLDIDSSLFDGLDAGHDAVLMIEAFEESTHVWSHKARTALFLSAMRHFAEKLRQRGITVHYRALEHEGDQTLATGLRAALLALQPERVIGVEPGDLRVRALIEQACKPDQGQRTPLEWREDKHFLCSLPAFRQWAGRSASLRMEFFYRKMRQQYKVLMDGEQPLGGQWNFDADNRKGFGKAGQKDLPRAPGAAAGGRALCRPPGRAEPLQLAGDPRAGPAGAG